MEWGSCPCTGSGTKTIPMEKKCKKAKWLSGEALQIAVKRREAKSKGFKPRNPQFRAQVKLSIHCILRSASWRRKCILEKESSLSILVRCFFMYQETVFNHSLAHFCLLGRTRQKKTQLSRLPVIWIQVISLVWGGRREEGSGWGTHVYLWWIHFDIWQN